ncbi:MAG: aminotransferase class I/II-fold pyridoxal phosphate-dependent enzyme [Candidatus Berkiella sp.]
MLSSFVQIINQQLVRYTPTQILLGGAAIGATVPAAYKLFTHDWQAEKEKWQQRIYDYLPKVPYIGGKFVSKLDKEFEPALDSLDKGIHEKRKIRYRSLPRKAVSQERILKDVKTIADSTHLADLISGGIYRDLSDPNLDELNAEIFKLAAYTNPLHGSAWPDLAQCEAEVIAWCAKLYGAREGTVSGNITPGGTYSIMEAMRTYKNWAQETKGIKRPNMVVPSTVHAAFDKGAKDYGIELIKVPVDGKTQRADVQAMAKKINNNTIALVGSAPSFPCGAIDPIKELGELAQRHNIGMHVDACLGGFLLPFAKEAGFDIGQFGFDLKGITSVSMDPHKYGQVPKMSSLILFDKIFSQFQAYINLDSPIGMYITPNQAGSRNGANILMTWGTLLSIGHDTYVKTTRSILNLKNKVVNELQSIPELRLLGEADLSVIAFDSHHLNIYAITEQMHHKGWHLNNIQNVKGAHLCLTANHLRDKQFTTRFIRDLNESIAFVKNNPQLKPKGDGAVYASLAAMPTLIAPQLKNKLGRKYVEFTANIEATRTSAHRMRLRSQQ